MSTRKDHLVQLVAAFIANPDTFGTADQFADHAVHYLAEIEKALGETRDEGGRLLTVNQQHVAKAVADEREHCAKIAEELAAQWEDASMSVAASDIAAAIRGAK